jgi:hypothetical protein
LELRPPGNRAGFLLSHHATRGGAWRVETATLDEALDRRDEVPANRLYSACFIRVLKKRDHES